MESEIIKIVNIEKIHVNKNQPRKTFNENNLNELAESIKENGIIQPLIVEEMSKDYYQIVAGERRYRASLIAKLKEVPVIVKKYDNIQRMQIAIIENVQREELNPLEEAYAYIYLLNEGGLKQEDLAKKIGKSRSSIANTIRLTTLEQKYIDAILTKEITPGHARALLSVQNRADREFLYNEIINKNINVRESENLASFLNNGGRASKDFNHNKLINSVSKNYNDNINIEEKENKEVNDSQLITENNTTQKIEKTQKQKDVNLLAAIKEIEEKFSNLLGTKVKVKGSEKSGKIIINYISYKGLENFYKSIGGKDPLLEED